MVADVDWVDRVEKRPPFAAGDCLGDVAVQMSFELSLVLGNHRSCEESHLIRTIV